MSKDEIPAALVRVNRNEGGPFRLEFARYGADAGPSYEDFQNLRLLGESEEIVDFVLRSLAAGSRSIHPLFTDWAISNCSVPLLDALFREDRLPINEQIPRSSDGFSYTPLSLSVQLNSGAALEYFIARGADLDTPGAQGMTALHYAADENSAALCLTLIRAGATVDSRDALGQTPLFVAGAWGHLQAFVVLHKAGARLDTKNKDRTGVWRCRNYRPTIDGYLRSCELRERLLEARPRPSLRRSHP